MTTFSERARALRSKYKLTQEAMAEKLGVSRTYYWSLESDKKEPSETLSKMLFLLEFSSSIYGNLDHDKEGPKPETASNVKEDQATYGDSFGTICNHLDAVKKVSNNVSDATKGWILSQLRRHISLSEIDEVEALNAEDNSEQKERSHSKKPINEHLSLSENSDYQEIQPAQPARPMPEYPGNASLPQNPKSSQEKKASEG